MQRAKDGQKKEAESEAKSIVWNTMKKTGVVQICLCGVKYEPHLMIYRGLGQRWDCKGEEPAVAIFIHNFLQHTEQLCC